MTYVSVKQDCRHYVMRSVRSDERIRTLPARCLAELVPFACPDSCVFYEPRQIATGGWQVRPRGKRGPAHDQALTPAKPRTRSRNCHPAG